ncbi:MAG: hypothetical protein WCI67_13880 [Chloroflexales bacterium]
MIVYPEHANHVLKHESRPRAQLSASDAVTAYNADGTVLDPDAVAAITGWLTNQH